MALDALAVGIQHRKVNWVLDADIRGCFDAIDHDWLMKFVEHRIRDRRVHRHLKKWLKAGVLEEGTWAPRRRAEEGVRQGSSTGPLLANLYRHYVFDVWAQTWRRYHARGEVILVVPLTTCGQLPTPVECRHGSWRTFGRDWRKSAKSCTPTRRASSSPAAMRRPTGDDA